MTYNTHMENQPTLSPAAQAVFNAFDYARDGEYVDGEWVVNERLMLAAALRAAANYLCSEVSDGCRGLFVQGVSASAETLEEIATELEANG
jgi:hypothetical protein